jgi:hypothetical protein
MLNGVDRKIHQSYFSLWHSKRIREMCRETMQTFFRNTSLNQQQRTGVFESPTDLAATSRLMGRPSKIFTSMLSVMFGPYGSTGKQSETPPCSWGEFQRTNQHPPTIGNTCVFVGVCANMKEANM